MSIIGWIVLGLIAGFIASKLVNHRGEGIILDIGAVVVLVIYHAVTGRGATIRPPGSRLSDIKPAGWPSPGGSSARRCGARNSS